LVDEKEIKRVAYCGTYIVNHGERMFDWRNIVEDAPKDARSVGCIESRQRHISVRMKRRGMHWSAKGAESMVKVKQGILNGTLREVYLMSQKRSKRKQREIKQTIHKQQKQVDNLLILQKNKTRKS